MSDLVDAALAYAAAGWLVHPCQEAGQRAKAPYLPHGFKEATSDPQTITRWWRRWPGALVGLAVPDGALVIDLDPHGLDELDDSLEPDDAARESLALLEELTGPLPGTLTAWSGRNDGGRHLWFRSVALPAGLRWRQPRKGLDLRTPRAGYLIAPPSPHPLTGEAYRWEDPTVPMAALSETALRTLTDGREIDGATETPSTLSYGPFTAPAVPRGRSVRGRQHRARRMAETMAAQGEGGRNRLLFRFSCEALRDFDDRAEDALVMLTDAAAQAGLRDDEIASTISSARRAVGREGA